MKLPRNLDGVRLGKHLAKHFGYEMVRQTGSHMRLRTLLPFEHAITIPAHTPLKPGTLSGILRAVGQHKQISPEELLRGL